MEYELKLKGGRVVTWEGKDGEGATRRYVDCHRRDIVVAFRPKPCGVYIYNHNINIIE